MTQEMKAKKGRIAVFWVALTQIGSVRRTICRFDHAARLGAFGAPGKEFETEAARFRSQGR
jgi:hypothetical protein